MFNLPKRPIQKYSEIGSTFSQPRIRPGNRLSHPLAQVLSTEHSMLREGRDLYQTPTLENRTFQACPQTRASDPAGMPAAAFDRARALCVPFLEWFADSQASLLTPALVPEGEKDLILPQCLLLL